MPLQTAVKSDIAVIQSDLKWHFRIGSGAIVFFAGLFGWFFTSYLPNALEHQRKDIVEDIQLKLDQLTKLQLDKLSAELSTVVSQSVAQSDKKPISELGTTVLELTNSKQADIQQASWKVTNQLLGFYSNIGIPELDELERHTYEIRGANINRPCLTSAKGAHDFVFSSAIFSNCTLELDVFFGPSSGVRFRYVIFKDAKVIYGGRPISTPLVYFAHCTFELRPSLPSQQLARTFLAYSRLPQTRLP